MKKRYYILLFLLAAGCLLVFLLGFFPVRRNLGVNFRMTSEHFVELPDGKRYVIHDCTGLQKAVVQLFYQGGKLPDDEQPDKGTAYHVKNDTYYSRLILEEDGKLRIAKIDWWPAEIKTALKEIFCFGGPEDIESIIVQAYPWQGRSLIERKKLAVLEDEADKECLYRCLTKSKALEIPIDWREKLSSEPEREYAFLIRLKNGNMLQLVDFLPETGCFLLEENSRYYLASEQDQAQLAALLTDLK